ncbi:MAG: adenylate kinase [Firmicutes bacterium HGW-Firmicutes-21]|nr:MAG: adenylate kinase [Firmicutes bacterium HGW-Firmicutes-21]
MNIIFFGPPGAGKGTQAEIICNELKIPTISTGAIIREAIKNGTEMGKAAKSAIESGALVSDSVVIGIIKERLSQPDCKNGYILDGFPRTIPQAEALDSLGVLIDAVLSIEVPDETIIERMSGRRTCIACGATYHTLYNPSVDTKTCDKCGTELSMRKDDAPEVVKNRLETYHEETEPLKDYYSARGVLKTVVGQEKLEDTTRMTRTALGLI